MGATLWQTGSHDGGSEMIGHNNPPVDIDDVTAPFAAAIEEAQNWLDGTVVETEAQMQAVDAILREIRSAGVALADAQKVATSPLHDAWKAEIARWKPTVDDLDRIKKGLAAAVDKFKRKLAAEKEAARRAAYELAEKARVEAEQAARKAAETDIEAQREAAVLAQAAMDAQKAAAAANKDTVKGLRTVTLHEVRDMRRLVNWIAANDKPAMAAFAEAYAAKNHETIPQEIVRTWKEKAAY